MKLVERVNKNGYSSLWLEHITQQDFKFRNLAGRPSPKNPNGGNHTVTVWIDDPDILAALKAKGIYIGQSDYEERDENGNPTGNVIESRHYVNLKAYPKMITNKYDGKQEPSPKVMLKNSGRTQQLDIDSLGIADGVRVIDVRIRIRIWDRKASNPIDNNVPVIQEYWVYVDENVGNFEEDDDYDDYLSGIGGAAGAEEDFEVPFN